MTKQGAGSTPSLPASDLGNTAGQGGKRINPRSHPFLESDLDPGYPAIRRKEEKHCAYLQIENNFTNIHELSWLNTYRHKI